MRKKVRILDDHLRELTDEMDELKYKIRKERRKKQPDERMIKDILSEIEEIKKERIEYYEEYYGDVSIQQGPREGWTKTHSSKEDARIAMDLHYPDHIIKTILNEPDPEKRQKLLTNARTSV